MSPRIAQFKGYIGVYVKVSGACKQCHRLPLIFQGLKALADLDPETDADDIVDLAAVACGSCSTKRPSLQLDDPGRLILELAPG